MANAFVCISSITEKHKLGTLYRAHSLRSKRFHLVSEQRKTEERTRNGLRVKKCAIFRAFLVLCSETARKSLLRRLSCIVLWSHQSHFIAVHTRSMCIRLHGTWTHGIRQRKCLFAFANIETVRGDRRSLQASSPMGGYREIPKISPSIYKPL